MCFREKKEKENAYSRTMALKQLPLLKLGRTLNLNLGCLGMGLIMSLTGVALLDLAEIYHSDIKTVSHLITSRCIGGLTGSLIGGRLFERFNTQVMCIVTVMITMVTSLLIPLTGNLVLVYVVVFFGGIGFGAFDTGANVWTMRLWPKNSNAALQVFHLSFGLGSLIAPLIAEPFLSITPSDFNSELSPWNETAYNVSTVPQPTSNVSLDGVESTVYYPFGMASAYHLLLLVSMVALYIIDRTDVTLESSNQEENAAEKDTTQEVRFGRTMVALLAFYICVYVAQEFTVGQMLTAYAVKGHHHLSKTSASRLVALYFLCFTLSRVLAAIVTIWVTSFQMLVVSHIVIAGSSVALFVFGNSYETVLWVCVAFLGVGQGPLYAAAVAWAVSYFNMTNTMMSVVIVASVIGEMSPPLTVGQFLDSYPDAFMYVCLVTAVVCVCVFLSMRLYVRGRPTLRTEETHKPSHEMNTTVAVTST